MKAVIQRVSRSKVTIDGRIHGEIGRGFVVLEQGRVRRSGLVDEVCDEYMQVNR